MHPWYTHYDPGVPKEAPRPWLLTDLLRENARRYPHKVALEFLGRSLSYRSLWQQVEAFAKGLQEAGLKPGDRVAIMLPNSPQFVIAFYGTLLAGGVAVNTNPMYTPRELGHQLRDSGARVLVILDLLLPRYQEVKAEAPVEVLVRTGIQDYLPFPKNLLYPLMLKRKGQAPRSLEGTPWRAFLKPGKPQPPGSVQGAFPKGFPRGDPGCAKPASQGDPRALAPGLTGSEASVQHEAVLALVQAHPVDDALVLAPVPLGHGHHAHVGP